DHYKWPSVVGLALGTAMMTVLAIWPTAFSLATFEIILAVAGMGIGTIFPITTTAVQNAVPPHEMGTATGLLNFSRSLGGAILVAVFGAIFLAALGAGEHASVQMAILEGERNGGDFAPVFRGVFAAAAVALAMAFVGMAAMEERP